jgi:hypothetical protein
VHAVDLLDTPPRHETIIDHGLAARATLFGRLENDDGGAIEVAGLGEVLCCTEQHGGMPVVAARMHLAPGFRSVGQAGALLERQRVHIGAQPKHPA